MILSKEKEANGSYFANVLRARCRNFKNSSLIDAELVKERDRMQVLDIAWDQDERGPKKEAQNQLIFYRL
jgi:hypothetical protein